MPYIPPSDRTQLHPMVVPAVKPGELNFQVMMLCLGYLRKKGLSYTALNEVVGVLECAKLELYRRQAAPYEDAVVDRNGDLAWVRA